MDEKNFKGVTRLIYVILEFNIMKTNKGIEKNNILYNLLKIERKKDWIFQLTFEASYAT